MQFTGNAPRSRCRACGKEIIVRSTIGRGSFGYCSRVCSSMKRYETRFKGMRSEMGTNPVDIEKRRHA